MKKNYRRDPVAEITSYASRLRLGRAFTRLVRFLAAIAIVSGITVLILCAGTSDYQSETHYIPTAAEQLLQTKLLWGGCIVTAVCGVLFAFCERINSFIDSELERCRRVRKNRIQKERDRRLADAEADRLQEAIDLIEAHESEPVESVS